MIKVNQVRREKKVNKVFLEKKVKTDNPAYREKKEKEVRRAIKEIKVIKAMPELQLQFLELNKMRKNFLLKIQTEMVISLMDFYMFGTVRLGTILVK